MDEGTDGGDSMSNEIVPTSPAAAITQSTVLAEAQVDSLGELMSRDPEGYTRQDRDRIVSALRADRERFARAEAEAAAKPRGRKSAGEAPSLSSSVNPEDLGL